MKKILLSVAIVFSLSTASIAEKLQEEATESLSTAQGFVKDGSYSKAVDEINYALAKVNELIANGLVKYIPDPPEGYTLVKEQAQGVGAAASLAGNAGATAEYSNQNGVTISLNIAIGGMTGKMAGIAALGSIFVGIDQDSATSGQTRQVRVKGYTGTEIFDSATQIGTLTFQVGDKTSVTFEGTNIESPEILMQLAEKVDMAGLEKNF